MKDKIEKLASEKYPYYSDSMPERVRIFELRAAFLSGFNAAGEWVSVETPPEKNGIYQIWDNGHDYALFHNGIWKTTDKQNNADNCCGIRTRQTLTPTLWQPLPQPPKQ